MSSGSNVNNLNNIMKKLMETTFSYCLCLQNANTFEFCLLLMLQLVSTNLQMIGIVLHLPEQRLVSCGWVYFCF